MKRRGILGAASLALAFVVSVVSILPVGCGGGGGGLTLGIATLGVSALFPGSSPPYCAIDLSLKPTDGTPVLPPTAAANPIELSASEEVELVFLPGGQLLRSGPLTSGPVLTLVATSTADTTIDVAILYAIWGQGPFAQDRVELVTKSASVGTQTATLTFDLDFPTIRFPLSDLVLTNLRTQPGDQLAVRLRNPSPSETITIDTSQSKLTFETGLTRETQLALDSTGVGGTRGVTGGRLVVGPAVSAQAGQGFVVFEQVLADLAATGKPEGIANASGQTVTTGADQAAIVRAVVTDNLGSPVGGVIVRFEAADAHAPVTQTASTDGNGIAGVSVSWPAAGAKVVTATAIDASGDPLRNVQGAPITTEIPVTVQTQQVARVWDGLRAFQVLSGDAATLAINVLDLANPKGAFANPKKVALPTRIVYVFPRDVTTGADWRHDLHVRTRSFETTATADFRVTVSHFDESGALLGSFRSKTLRALSGLQRFADTLTPTGTADRIAVDVTASPTPGTNPVPSEIGSIEVAFQVLASSDATAPGIEVVTDPAAGSFIRVPGPVVFASTYTNTSNIYMCSMPDPREPGNPK